MPITMRRRLGDGDWRTGQKPWWLPGGYWFIAAGYLVVEDDEFEG